MFGVTGLRGKRKFLGVIETYQPLFIGVSQHTKSASAPLGSALGWGSVNYLLQTIENPLHKAFRASYSGDL